MVAIPKHIKHLVDSESHIHNQSSKKLNLELGVLVISGSDSPEPNQQKSNLEQKHQNFGHFPIEEALVPAAEVQDANGNVHVQYAGVELELVVYLVLDHHVFLMNTQGTAEIGLGLEVLVGSNAKSDILGGHFGA